ncbi:MAG TPA: TldD/PmbA family protein [Thermoplasmata archaeon]|nr:TldD/PmbA family protein [Thermoplasmata archaeon]
MADLRDHEPDLERLLTRLGPRCPFAEVMAERRSGEGILVERRSTTPQEQPRLQGAVVRAWAGTRWVEAACSALDFGALSVVGDSVQRSLEAISSQAPPPGESTTTTKEWATAPAHPVSELGMDGLARLGHDILGWATSVHGVRECRVALGWADDQRVYANTAGARCFQTISRVRATVIPIAMENGNVEFDFLGRGGVGGRELFDFLTEESVRQVSQDAIDLLHAKAPPTGEMEVLLDASVAGLLAHESFGHGTEADQFVRDRSYLKPILGQTVGPEELTIVDDGSFPGGWGSIYFDDEGHPGQKTLLVEGGRFVGALHDRETASLLNAHATGNTRRADFLSRAFVRMTNTYVEPGDWTVEELIAETKNGVLLERGSSGIEDPLGGRMQLKVKKGRRIENGKVTDLVRSMALSGQVLDFLRDVRGVARAPDFWIEPGYCGKGHTDLLPVGTGGAHLLSTAVVGPA